MKNWFYQEALKIAKNDKNQLHTKALGQINMFITKEKSTIYFIFAKKKK